MAFNPYLWDNICFYILHIKNRLQHNTRKIVIIIIQCHACHVYNIFMECKRIDNKQVNLIWWRMAKLSHSMHMCTSQITTIHHFVGNHRHVAHWIDKSTPSWNAFRLANLQSAVVVTTKWRASHLYAICARQFSLVCQQIRKPTVMALIKIDFWQMSQVKTNDATRETHLGPIS